MNDNKNPNMTVNIYGGNVQTGTGNCCQQQIIHCAPQAATRWPEEDAEETPETETPEPVTDTFSPLSPFINDEELLSHYRDRLSACLSAAQFGLVVVDMVLDSRVKVDAELMVKGEFIERIRQLSPEVKTQTSNIRKYINFAWESKNRKRDIRK